MSETIGRRVWAIAEGWLPDGGLHRKRSLTSHETVCLLNPGDADATVRITVFFADREPAGPFVVVVPARRTRHVRFDDLSEPEAIPRGTDFSSTIVSDVPIVVQHTRLDRRKGALSLMTTTAYAQD